MPEPLDVFAVTRAPCAERPLTGHTILVVEDSRYASEALRLMCQRSGARIRRADSLASAHRHLRVYRPSAVIIDLGLPDGSGLDLIADLAQATPRVDVLIATSGDADAADTARTAGADGFLAKPIASLGSFQQAILAHLPPDQRPPGPRLISNERVAPDPLALRDDMAHAAELLSDDPDTRTIAYLAQFIGGIAASASDRPLAEAAAALSVRNSGSNAGDIDRLAGLVRDRLNMSAIV